MKIFYNILILVYKKIPYLRSIWRNILPADITIPVLVDGKFIKVFKAHWAGILFKRYEPQTLCVFRKLIKDHETFIDIGANVGLFSNIAIKNGLHVTAFEPHPDVRRVLKDNLRGSNATIYPYGLSNKSTEVKLFISNEPGSHSLFLDSDKFTSISTRPLDELISSKIDLVKIDVEGAEMNVLMGMEELLKNSMPDIIIEVDKEHLKRFGKTPEDLFSFLVARGYKYKKIGSEENYLFVSEDKISLFKEVGIPDKILWVEWLGLWGSGKTTSILDAIKYIENKGEKIISPNTFFSNRRYQKFALLLMSLPSTIVPFLLFIYLVFPSYVRMIIKKDIIGLHEIRSFVSCFLARLSMSANKNNAIYLWEGEFHMLPILSLKKNAMDKLIDFFLDLNHDKQVVFAYIELNTEVVKNRILEDHKSGRNLRFHSKNIDLFIDFLEQFDHNQKYLIERLKSKGQIIYKSDGNNTEELLNAIGLS